MSEYWKSTPKYWCKHCSVYIRDTNFERKQHENTAKHQGNLKKFLRTIQNDHERNEREKDRTKAELDRLARIVGGPSQSQAQASAGRSDSATAQSSARATAAKPSVADQKRQWAQLAELGIAVPESARGEVAMPGDWHVVKQETAAPQTQSLSPKKKLNVGVRKRRLEDDDEADHPEQATARKVWGSSTKSYPGASTLDDNLDDLLGGSILKKPVDVNPKQEPDSTADNIDSTSVNSTAAAPVKIEHPDVADLNTSLVPRNHSATDDATYSLTAEDSDVKSEPVADLSSALAAVPDSVAAAPLFKKRKAKTTR